MPSGEIATDEMALNRMAKSVRRTRRGLTLIELLVAISIVGTLAGLLLPAVSATREAARRMLCSNHLRQVGIGLHAYHNVYGTFPSGHVADLESGQDGRSWGWGALLLPFVEQNALSEQLNTSQRSFDEVASDEAAAPFLETNIGIYRCPSDPGDDLSHPYRSLIVYVTVPPTGSQAVSGADLANAHVFRPPPPKKPPTPKPKEPKIIAMAVRIAKSNYVGSIGSQWKPKRSDWNNKNFEGNGLFGRNSDMRISKIFDGTSNTIAVGERCMRNYAAVWAGGNSWSGCGFADNQMVLGTAFYPINDAPVSQNIDCDGRGAANFSSYHSGGANFVFADGSLHVLSEHIDLRVFRHLAQRNDGKELGDY